MFEVTQDVFGNVYAAGGQVRNLDATVVLQSGPDGYVPLLLGGSGLNLVLSGFPAGGPNGVWKYVSPGLWMSGEYLLDLDASTSAEIRDGEDVIATLSSGGPTGSYASTTYGATLLGSSFTATAAADPFAPGTLPDAAMKVSAGTLPEATFSAVDGNTWECTTDADLTIEIAADGTAEMIYAGRVIATRADGNPGLPDGTYEATQFGRLTYNPAPAPSDPADPTPDGDPDPTTPPGAPTGGASTTEDDADVILPGSTAPDPEPDAGGGTNPFGILTLTISWGPAADLDTGTTFLGETVGYGHSGSSPYLEWTGDDVSESGDEIITVDLAAAWEAGDIGTFAEVALAADWFPSAGGSGPATLTVSYSLSAETQTYTLAPGSVSPSTTAQLTLRVMAGALAAEPKGLPWRAVLTSLAVEPPAGVVFVSVTEVSSTLDSVGAPVMASTIPANTSTVFNVPLAEISADGEITQNHSGPLFWR